MQLEALGIMPKTAPGLEKIKKALVQKSWFNQLDPRKIITVAGTNGKGSTCAILESLLLCAHQRVGFYSSPHLVKTTERIRINGSPISEKMFCDGFEANKRLIDACQLSHFESLTLIAADIFFSKAYTEALDYVIFEVGLGGTFDATNAFEHHWSVITRLAMDHIDILGPTFLDVAKNKFGIIRSNTIVVHHSIDPQLQSLVDQVKRQTNTIWIEARSKLPTETSFSENFEVFETPWGLAKLSLLGKRGIENAMTALTLFEQLGFEPAQNLKALEHVNWPGRMQKINLQKFGFEVFLSGDHNEQGILSLIEILKERFQNKRIHFIVGIGKDKDCDRMLEILFKTENSKVYLTETPFKGRKISDYSEIWKRKSEYFHADVNEVLNFLQKQSIQPNHDIVIVTGSLYLVGEVLKLNHWTDSSTNSSILI